MAILPIAGTMQEYPAVPHRRPKGRARALALRLMDQSGLGDGPDPRPRFMRSPAAGCAEGLRVPQRPE